MGARPDADGNSRNLKYDRFRLPVSGRHVTVRAPSGLEDLLLRESRAHEHALALELFTRLIHPAENDAAECGDLPAADGEALLLALRRTVLGDLLRAEVRCAEPDCAARVDISFRIGEYLAARKPRKPAGLKEAEKEGWFALSGESIRFRLPTCTDLAATGREPDAYAELIRRCIEPAGVSARLKQRVEKAMEALAPRFSQIMTGRCPECEREFGFYFDVHSFVLRELRSHAASVYRDVHLLALYYKWPEQQILAMPRNRRIQYVEMLREQGVAA